MNTDLIITQWKKAGYLIQTYPSQERAKIVYVMTNDRKMHMIIPVRFHSTIKKFNMLGQYVDVEITDVRESSTVTDYY